MSEATTLDRRGPLVLDCLDGTEPPFSTGTLLAFRQRLIAPHLDRRLIERTSEVATQQGVFGPRPLRAALARSPVWGASRVEAPSNLLGHARRKALGVSARKPGRELAESAAPAGAGRRGGSSLKAALDLDGDDPAERERALPLVLLAREAVEHWLAGTPQGRDDPPVAARVTAAQPVRTPAVELAANQPPLLRRKVAKERRLAIEAAQMRHGRTRQSQRITGDQRPVLRDLASGLLRAVGVTSANTPAAALTEARVEDLAMPPVRLSAFHRDRASLASSARA